MNIFDVEYFDGLLNDIRVIFEEKNLELDNILSKTMLDSVKNEKIRPYLFLGVSYRDALKRIKEKFIAFKKSTDIQQLNEHNQSLVKGFSKKLNSVLLKSEKFIQKCDNGLIVCENTKDLT